MLSITFMEFVRIRYYLCFFFFFNDTATTEIYTLSLHDALPILSPRIASAVGRKRLSPIVEAEEPAGSYVDRYYRRGLSRSANVPSLLLQSICGLRLRRPRPSSRGAWRPDER